MSRRAWHGEVATVPVGSTRGSPLKPPRAAVASEDSDSSGGTHRDEPFLQDSFYRNAGTRFCGEEEG
ncbi:unnamed protein product [Gadus morhua 'NCC']